MIGGSYHKHQFCRDKHVIVATKHVFCRDKNMLVATNIFLSLKIFVATNIIYFCRDKHVSVATK